MKVIVYSLFGYERGRQESCFDFNSYLRGLMINIRMNRLIYPDWEISLQTDKATYAAWGKLFDKLPITVHVHDDNVQLTLAMLWRLKPVYEMNGSEWKYTHVLCRDLDSPSTYREAQAVKYWMNRDKTMHAITDSISHNLPLLGGMIGIIPKHFTHRTNTRSWDQLVHSRSGYDWARKGMDQTFLNDVVYPQVAQPGIDSITQHYVLGMPNTFLSDYHNEIPDMELDIPFHYKESNGVCGHIGAAGYYETAMFKFLRRYWDQFNDLLEIEKEYSQIFYWVNE